MEGEGYYMIVQSKNTVKNFAAIPNDSTKTLNQNPMPKDFLYLHKNDDNGKTGKQIKFKGLGNILPEFIRPPYGLDSWLAKGIMWLGERFKGEPASVLFNGFGTLFIAGLMIAFAPTVDAWNFLVKINPLTKEKDKKYAKKEPKENRYYSSLRQPVSAFLAITMQLFMTGVGNNLIKGPANAGKLGKLMKSGVAQAGAATLFGLICTLLTLPFQIKLQNWIFPKFVKLVRPDLAKDKKSDPKKEETAKTGGKK